MPPRDLYAVLGVAPDATTAELARAYRRLLRRYHPDTRDGERVGADGSDGALRQVIAAYSILRDHDRRAGYDRQRRRETPDAPSIVGSTGRRHARTAVGRAADQGRTRALATVCAGTLRRPERIRPAVARRKSHGPSTGDDRT